MSGHEPTPNPSQEGNCQNADEFLLTSWEGLGVGRFMERAQGQSLTSAGILRGHEVGLLESTSGSWQTFCRRGRPHPSPVESERRECRCFNFPEVPAGSSKTKKAQATTLGPGFDSKQLLARNLGSRSVSPQIDRGGCIGARAHGHNVVGLTDDALDGPALQIRTKVTPHGCSPRALLHFQRPLVL